MNNRLLTAAKTCSRYALPLLLLIACSSVSMGQVLVNGPFFDDTTRGDWRGIYGDCFYLIPSPPGPVFEYPTGPDFFSNAPGQYASTACYGGPLFNNDPLLSHVDWRVFMTTNQEETFTWSYLDQLGQNGIRPNASQWNPCLNEFQNGTWDNHRFTNDPLGLELVLDAGGDATIAYYFINGDIECRGLDLDLYVNDVLASTARIWDFAAGSFRVWDLVGMPAGSPTTVRLEVSDMPSIPGCDPPADLDDTGLYGLNSIIAGVYVSGTDVCGGPFCGDGNLDAGEECDDGNNDDGDGCSSECTTEVVEPFCGDGNLDAGEECDDGNNADGDGCSSECTIEIVGQGCTPGYWKQRHHFFAWTQNTPSDSYSTVFGVSPSFGDITLLAALHQGWWRGECAWDATPRRPC